MALKNPQGVTNIKVQSALKGFTEPAHSLTNAEPLCITHAQSALEVFNLQHRLPKHQ